MNKTLTIGAIVAIILVGAVTTLTPLSLVQQAEAAACSIFLDLDTGQFEKINCSEKSTDNANTRNSNVHILNNK